MNKQIKSPEIEKKLEMIGQLRPGLTISTTQMKVVNHRSWSTAYYRLWNGENRDLTLSFIEKSISDLEILQEIYPRDLLMYRPSVRRASEGLIYLKMTYDDDNIRLRIDGCLNRLRLIDSRLSDDNFIPRSIPISHINIQETECLLTNAVQASLLTKVYDKPANDTYINNTDIISSEITEISNGSSGSLTESKDSTIDSKSVISTHSTVNSYPNSKSLESSLYQSKSQAWIGVHDFD